MKTSFRLLLLLQVLLFVSCAPKKTLVGSDIVILPLGDTVHLTEGSLVYGLPMTIFKIDVETEKTIEIPGPYAKFAGDMLGMKDVITQESEYWSVNNIKVTAYEELDPSEFYLIETNTLVQSNAFALRKAGLILDINPDLYEKNENGIINKLSDTEQLKFTDLGADEYFLSQTDTSYRIVNVDTTFIRIPYLVERKKQFTIEQLAEKAAKTLLELREGKHLILTGEANVFPQSGAAIDEINRLDKEYTALFAGKTLIETRTFSYTFIPQKEMSGQQVPIFKFSDLTGPADASVKSGIPVTVELIPALKTKDITIISRLQPGIEPAQKSDKLFYRIPDVVTISIKMGTEILFSSRRLIYQFGEVVQLPANFIIGIR